MMQPWKRTTIATGALGLVILFGLAAGPAAAQTSGDEETTTLRLNVKVERFVMRNGEVFARGGAVARAVAPDGTTAVVEKPVRLQLQPTRRCRIARLHLAPLFLNLLGLEVRTSAINLRITGDRDRLLGGLLCGLTRGLALDRPRLVERSVRSLNRRLDARALPVMKLRMPLHAKQQSASEVPASSRLAKGVPPIPPGSCEVLDLLLGPLHLDLLGLIVDLFGPTPSDPVRVHVTANPAGGILGSLLCGLGGTPTP